MTWFNKKSEDEIKRVANAGAKAKVKPKKDACPHGEGSGCVRCFMEEVEKPSATITIDMNETDLYNAVLLLPDKIVHFLKVNSNKAYLAGGYLRSVIGNEPISDYDIFFSYDKANLQSHLHTWSPSADLAGIEETENSFLIPKRLDCPPIQFIWRWKFTDAKDLIDKFDFTIAKAVIWYNGSDWCGLVCDTYYQDLAAKRIVYSSGVPGNEGAGHIARLLKFIARGYSIGPNDLANILTWSISSIKCLGEVDRSALKAELFLEIERMQQGNKPTLEKLSKPVPPTPPRERSSYSYS